MAGIKSIDKKTLDRAAAKFNGHLDRHIQEMFVREGFEYPVHHYTGLDGLKGILRSGYIRLMRIEDLEDKAEFRGPMQLALTEIERRRDGGDKLHKFFFERFGGGVTRALDGKYGFFTASFCQHPESKHQWEHFGRRFAGARISISDQAFMNGPLDQSQPEDQVFVYPMRYGDGEAALFQKRAIDQAVSILGWTHVRKILMNGWQDGAFLKAISIDLAVWLIYNATKFKEPGFAPECEVRVLLLNESDLIASAVETLPDGRKFIPYRFDRPMTAQGVIDNITVGALAPPDAEAEITALLTELGYPAIPVLRSTTKP